MDNRRRVTLRVSREQQVFERSRPDGDCERLRVETAVDSDEAPHAEQREPKSKLNGRELRRDYDHEREPLASIREPRLNKAKSLDRDAEHLKLRTARVAMGRFLKGKESPAGHGARVERQTEKGRRFEANR